MNLHHGIQIPACAAAVLVLSSCVVKDGSLDFTWWKDAAAPVMEDDVIIDSGSGQHYRSTPAPVQIPATPQPKQAENPYHEPKGLPKATGQQQPRVTEPANTPTTHLVQRGDTLSALARRYGTSVRALVTANGMASADVPLLINQTLVIPTANTTATPAGTHLVQPGDTLYGIARRYGVSATKLMQINGLTPETANTIRVGTTLRIPAAH